MANNIKPRSKEELLTIFESTLSLTFRTANELKSSIEDLREKDVRAAAVSEVTSRLVFHAADLHAIMARLQQSQGD